MEVKTCTFLLKKETKGTHVYEEQPQPNQAPIIGSLYIRKGTFSERAASLEVTVKRTA